MNRERENEVDCQENNQPRLLGIPHPEENEEVPAQESFRQRAARSERRRRRKGGKIKPGCLGVLVALFAMVVIVGVMIAKKYAPSTVVMPLTQYFDSVAENEVLLIEHDTLMEERGMLDGEKIYLPYEYVVDHINKRFYFDTTENILSFTTATEVVRTELGSSVYTSNKKKTDVGYEIVRSQGEAIYLAIDYVKEFSNVEYEFFKEPNRLVLEDNWGTKYQYYNVTKDTKLRTGAGIKCDVLASLEENDKLRVAPSEQELESYQKVVTKDGVTGFVLKKYLSDVYEEELKNDYKEVEYSNISMNKTVCMAWHQVTNQTANNELLNMISGAKGLNVISPTWFSLTNNKGDFSSLASDSYVYRAHTNGLQVWALCDDFKVSEGTVDLAVLLGNTSNRDKLINRLVASSLEYNLDGINIDFENVKEDTAAAYLEFLRELSVKCRNNGLVLSVDSYVPKDFSAFYDREEQGKIVDYVVVMAYDEHYGGSKESGSVASISFVEEAVDKITEMVEPSKVIIGMPFYTRFWKETPTEDGVKVTSTAYGMNQQEKLLSNNGVSASWDDETGQNYVQFDYNNATYKMWMEDEKSIELKLQTIFRDFDGKKIAGVSGWKLGLQKDSIWNVIQKYTN